MAEFNTPTMDRSSIVSRSSMSSTGSTRSGTAKTWHLNRAFYNYQYSDRVPAMSQKRIGKDRRLGGHFGRVVGCDFHNDTTLVSAADDSKMLVWDIESGLKKAWINLATGSIPTCCSIDQTERRFLASGGLNCNLDIFDIEKILKAQETHLLNNIVGSKKTQKTNAAGRGANPLHGINDLMHGCKNVTQPEFVLAGHKCFISDISWCNDGRRLISSSGDSTSTIWDMEVKGKLASYQAHKGDVTCVACSPTDYHIFITAGDDGMCYVWDTRTKKSVGSKRSSFGKNMEPAQAFARTPSSDPIDNVSPADLSSGLLSGTNKDLWKHEGAAPINCVSFFPDGHAFLAGGEDGMTSIFDMRCDAAITSIESDDRNSPVNACLFSASGRLVFLGCADGNIRVYDLTRQERAPPMRASDSLCVLDEHRSEVNALCLSPDGSKVVSGSDDMSLYVWK